MKKKLSISTAVGLVALAATMISAQPASAAGISIADANLKTCVNNQLGQAADADITQAQALSIQELSCQKPLSTLSGIEALSNLIEFINFSENSTLADLQPLSGLTKVKRIAIFGSSVSDASALKDLPALTNLGILNSKISDAGTLSSLTQVQHLNVDGNQITDFRPLKPLLDAGVSVSADEKILLPTISVGVSQDNPVIGLFGETPAVKVTNGVLGASPDPRSWFYLRANAKNILVTDFSADKRYPSNLSLSVTVQQASLPTVTTLQDDIVQTKYQTPITIDVAANDGQERQAAVNRSKVILVSDEGNAGTWVTLPQGKFEILSLEGKVVFTPAAGFSGKVPRVRYDAVNLDGINSTAYIYVTVAAAPLLPAKPTTPVTKPADTKTDNTSTSGVPQVSATSEAASAQQSESQRTELANTGSNPALPLSLGGLLLLAGTAATFFARNKKTDKKA